MNKIYALVIVTVLLLSGSKWCYGQNVASGESAAQGKMREKTKSDMAAEKIQKKQHANTVLYPKSKSAKKSESDELVKRKLEYSHKSRPEAAKKELIKSTDQAGPEKEIDLRVTKGLRKMNDTSKIKKVQETDGSKKIEENPKQRD
ncbi:MAG TPA: hypothetical protein EYN41_08710 [Flavobacteriales bacterium]|nr:hypothetical protein [Flavobacteriales bacterium]